VAFNFPFDAENGEENVEQLLIMRDFSALSINKKWTPKSLLYKKDLKAMDNSPMMSYLTASKESLW